MPGDHATQVVAYAIPIGIEIKAFRVVKVSSLGDEALIDSFRSHYELQRPPRKIEVELTVLHMGVSCWGTESAARNLAAAFPKIGGHIARLQLVVGSGFSVDVAPAVPPVGHLTVWGDPVKLAAVVADVVPV